MVPERSPQNLAARATAMALRLKTRATASAKPQKSLDLVAVILIAVMSMVITVAVGNVAIRTLFALPLVFVLPGYALVEAAFPRTTPGLVERLLMALGISLALTAIAGLALNMTPWGLTGNSWSFLLGGITLGASVIAMMMRARRQEQWTGASGSAPIGLSRRQGMLLGLAAVTLAVATVIAHNGAAGQPQEGFTQLWIQPVHADSSLVTVRIGVKDLETTTEHYTLSVVASGKVVRSWSLMLKPGQEWDATTAIPVTQVGNGPVEARLYLKGAPQTIYRHVILWPSK